MCVFVRVRACTRVPPSLAYLLHVEESLKEGWGFVYIASLERRIEAWALCAVCDTTPVRSAASQAAPGGECA